MIATIGAQSRQVTGLEWSGMRGLVGRSVIISIYYTGVNYTSQ